ncbi:hypothetical protein M1D80_11050 [Phyllobacteriaceae bacterium JZ32]
MKPIVSIREALADPKLLGNAIPGDSWKVWRTLMIACMGEALDDEERELFKTVTGRDSEPLERVEEFWGVIGRRGGKTRAIGTLGAYVSTLCDWSDVLAPGERGVLPVLAASTSQADRAFQHIAGVLQHSPVLAEMIDGEPTSDTIRLTTSIDIQIRPANFRTIRGVTSIAAICDEVAFWSIDGSANPDREVIDAVRPSLATTGGPILVISSPYARRGELYATHKRHFGKDGDPLILVAQGPSKTFNPTLSDKLIARAYERDPSVAAAEYGGAFRTDVEALLTREAVEAAVDEGVIERPRIPGVRYTAFVDPSGGSSDSMTMAIGHMEGDVAMLDVLRERKPPFSPEAVTAEFADTLKAYGLTSVEGDRFGGEWPRERFKSHGIEYKLADKAKSELYLGLVPALNSKRVALLDNARLTNQLVGLERRTARGGRDIIDHAPGQHDDIANAVAGVVHRLITRPKQDGFSGIGAPMMLPFVSDPYDHSTADYFNHSVVTTPYPTEGEYAAWKSFKN